MKQRNWRLPDGVDELLPPRARSLELVRRAVLDLFHGWGFDYVEPPLIEYLDALLVAGGADLDLQTLKVVDQRSGRMLGVRADMTSQAARIDAHRIDHDGVTRLCYAGTVVYANPLAFAESRVPVKAGAEIFGSDSLAADEEVVALMVEVLRTAGVQKPLLVLGHMGIYHALTADLELNPHDAQALFEAVQSKSENDIADLLNGDASADLLVSLPRLMGSIEIVEEARATLASAPVKVQQSIDALQDLGERVQKRCPEVALRFDLAELAGYGYHNGPVFAAFHGDHGRALARGGRYDGIGAAFGRGRPATGFDVNLKQLLDVDVDDVPGVWAPWAEGQASVGLMRRVAELREAGYRVVCALSADQQRPPSCDAALQLEDGQWVLFEKDDDRGS
ncbi:MAG: ATP phosphoribosyltransferase regulatory subunit [Gammaproteobacteria bacterium]|nr:ATP phosphoribosyltransferase regulatory subunit [Gammaproteobacteria bacterium]